MRYSCCSGVGQGFLSFSAGDLAGRCMQCLLLKLPLQAMFP